MLHLYNVFIFTLEVFGSNAFVYLDKICDSFTLYQMGFPADARKW